MALFACSKEDDTAKQAAIDEEKIKNYLEERDLTATKDDSGLYYRILTPGTESFSTSDWLKISYVGRFIDGTEFESGTTEGFLQYYIKGWQIGIPKLKVGGEAMLYIPSALGYGENWAGSIPPNSVLVFYVKVESAY